MVDSAAWSADGNLRLVLATWIYLLHVRGSDPVDEQLRAACARIDEALEPTVGDDAGARLVGRVAELVPANATPSDVEALARTLYGEAVSTALGQGSREERCSRVRRYQFGRSLPWMARIWERKDGAVGPSWLLVEEMTDEVRAVDPNPWNDVDEQRVLPLHDFLVLWELDGCTAIHLG